MTCDCCPYALLCLGDYVARGYCVDCGVTMLELQPSYQFDYMKGEYVDQETVPGRWVMLRCPPNIVRKEILSCPKCKPLLPMWREEIVEDLRAL
jgi:hypothetical protein